MTASKEHLTGVINASLKRAEQTWAKHGAAMTKKATLRAMSEGVSRQDARLIPSAIPEHETVDTVRPEVDHFIAFIIDMRSSTHHLNEVRHMKGITSGFQRVFYETSALLNATTEIVVSEEGGVTEYLGDGLLALFHAPQTEKERDDAIYASWRAAKASLDCVFSLINPILLDRYALPGLSVGIGLAMSPALVTVMGPVDREQPKVLGQCVFRASKLSKKTNEIWVDDVLRLAWPKSEGGPIRFVKTVEEHGFKGHQIRKEK